MADQPTPPINSDAFSARMFDHDLGKYTDVPAHQVTDAVKSGRYTFPAGMKIPSVSADGQLGSTTAEAAYNDFTHHGVQWATPQLQQAAEQQQQQKIQSDAYGDQPLTAAIAGGFRAGFGASDVALRAGGLGDATAALAQENPGASMVGEGIGTVALAALTGGLGGLGEGLGATAGKILAEQGAPKALQTVAPVIVREAAQGSVFGLGSGISEQALGQPDDVVDNFVSHVGMGALFGGVLGGVFGTAQVARPYISSLVEKATEGGSTLANKAVSSVLSGRMSAALNQAGEEEAAKVLGAAAKDPQFMQIYREQGPEAARQAVQANSDVISDLKDHIGTLEKDLRSGLKDASSQTKETVAQAVQDTGGNIFDANTQVYKQLQQSRAAFDNLTQTLTHPIEESTASETFNTAVDTLKGLDSPIARNIGTKIDNLLRSTPFQTAGDEAGFLFNIRNILKNTNIEKLPTEAKSYVSSLMEEADQSLLSNPNPAVSVAYKAVKGLEDASDGMRAVADKTVNRITKAVLPGETPAEAGYQGASRLLDSGKIARTLADPQTRATVSAVLENLEQFAPEIKQASLGMKNVETRIAYQNALEAKMAKISPKGHIDGADVSKVLDQLGSPKDLGDKLDKIVEAQKILQNPSAIDRVIAAKRSLGQPVSDDILKVGKYQQQFDFLNKVADTQGTGYNPLRIGRAAFKLLHGNIGGALMDVALGVQKTTVGDTFKTLAQIQKISDRGAQTIQKTIKTTVNMLTGSKAQTAAKAVGYGVLDAPTLKEQRKAYPQLATSLAQAPEPHPLQDHAPQLAQAFQARQQQAQQYLAQHLPQDPLKSSSLTPNKTGYVPSDQDLASFSKRVQAVNNPMQVLEKIGQNKASPEEIDALKTLNPGIYQKLQQAVVNGIVNSKVDLSYQKKIQLGTLLQIPTDYTLQPAFLSRMQQTFQQDQGGRPQGSPTRNKPIDIKPNTTVATQAQQVTYGLKGEE